MATDPRVVEIREREPEAWWHCLDQHPIVAHRAGSHDGRAVRFSDFLTRRELRRRELYQIFFRPVEAEYVSSSAGRRPSSSTSAARAAAATSPRATA